MPTCKYLFRAAVMKWMCWQTVHVLTAVNSTADSTDKQQARPFSFHIDLDRLYFFLSSSDSLSFQRLHILLITWKKSIMMNLPAYCSIFSSIWCSQVSFTALSKQFPLLAACIAFWKSEKEANSEVMVLYQRSASDETIAKSLWTSLFPDRNCWGYSGGNISHEKKNIEAMRWQKASAAFRRRKYAFVVLKPDISATIKIFECRGFISLSSFGENLLCLNFVYWKQKNIKNSFSFSYSR